MRFRGSLSDVSSPRVRIQAVQKVDAVKIYLGSLTRKLGRVTQIDMNENSVKGESERDRSDESGSWGSNAGFRERIMASVSKAVPGLAEKWNRSGGAEAAAVGTVKDAIRRACEISVAMASSKQEADQYISEAERQLLSGDKKAMGLHLAARLDAIDATVAKRERNGWSETTPEAKKFIQSNFGELCAKLDAVALDPVLISHCVETRKLLFPKVCDAEYRRESARGPLRFVGHKGVSAVMSSGPSRYSVENEGSGETKTVAALRAGASRGTADRGEVAGREF